MLVALVGFKDSILTVFSQLKAPLNALAQGLHAVGAVVGFAYLGANVFGGNAPNATASLEPLFAAEPTWLDHLGNGFLWILMALIHSAVWIVFNLVEVAVLLNPIPFVDTALKAARTALIGLIALATQIHPILGFVLVLPIIAICFASVPFALRFAILGTVFTWDTVRRWFGHKPYPGGAIRAFTSMGMPGVRLAVCGTVERGRTGLEFVYRRFFLLWKVRVPLPMEQLAVSKGLLAPRLVLVGGEGKGAIWLRFAPRYQKSEADLAGWLGLGDVMPYRFGSTIGSAWRDLKQIWSRRGKGGKA